MKTFPINLYFWMMVQFMKENYLNKKGQICAQDG